MDEGRFGVNLNLFRIDNLHTLLKVKDRRPQPTRPGVRKFRESSFHGVCGLVVWLFAKMNDWMIGDSDDCVSIVAEPSNVSASGRIHVGVGFHQTSPPPTPEPRAVAPATPPPQTPEPRTGAPAPPPPANQLPHHSPPEYPLAASAVEYDRQMVKPTKHKPVKRVTFKVQND